VKILLGVTGSVAAILTPKLVSALKDLNAEIKVIATQRGLFFFDKNQLNVPVQTDKDEWPETGYLKNSPVLHIDLGDWADIFLIAPLTADTLSDIAHGKADKFLTSTVLAWPHSKPIIIAPAMNTKMWENPITQGNIITVTRNYNIKMVQPIEGDLACGTHGIGAMARIESIIKEVSAYIR